MELERRRIQNLPGQKTTVRLVNSQHRGYRESDEEIVLQHLTAPAHLKLYVSNRAAEVSQRERLRSERSILFVRKE